MALWGNRELVYDFSTVEVDLSAKTITGSGTTFTDAAVGISTGNVITVGAGATYGYAVVRTIESDTVISVASTDFLIGEPTAATYSISEEPLYTITNGALYKAPEAKTTGFSTSLITTAVYGVDKTEVGVANTATGDARKYAPPHSGWVGITTYIDCHGQLRVKSEVLVAGSIVNDAEDTVYPDA